MHFVGQIVKVHVLYNEFAMLSKCLMFSVKIISETYCIKLALMFFFLHRNEDPENTREKFAR